jgi:hypothetical protein
MRISKTTSSLAQVSDSKGECTRLIKWLHLTSIQLCPLFHREPDSSLPTSLGFLLEDDENLQ